MNHPFKHVHFLGICGTAMGAVAAAMRDGGFAVTGQDDNVYPPMSTFLKEKGITITHGYRPEDIPAADLIVIGNAMTRGNPAVESVLNRKLYYLSLPETLKQFFLRGKPQPCRHRAPMGRRRLPRCWPGFSKAPGLEPSYLIGGIPANLGQGACLRDSKHFIIEGDEYDTAFFDKRSKFLHYLPELVIVNNIEFDHADIYRDLDEIKTSFRRLLNIVPSEGMVLLNADDPNCVDVARQCPAPIVEVGFSENAGQPNSSRAPPVTGSPASSCSTPSSKFRCWAISTSAMLRWLHRPRISTACRWRKFRRPWPIQRYQTPAGSARRGQGHHRHRRFRPPSHRDPRNPCRTARPVFEVAALGHLRTAIEHHATRRVSNMNCRNRSRRPTASFLSRVARIEQIPEGERLNPERVVSDIAAAGKPAFYEPTADDIVERLKPLAKAGDVVVVFSNGGFDGIHQKLLDRLG